MPISNDSLRAAIEEIIAAVNNRNYTALQSRVDLTEFVNLGYDDAIDQLAINCEEFHAKYPDDLLFQFGAQALRDYNAKYRLVHIGFIFAVINAYFDSNLDESARFEQNPIAFAATHLKKLIAELQSEIVTGVVEGDRASVSIKIRAELIGELTFRLGMRLVEGRWRVIRIENADELVRPIVDIGEKIWPREWDRGMKIN